MTGPADPPPSDGTGGPATRTVLLVEPPGAAGLTATLRAHGFRVIGVDSPETALFEYSHHDIDAVVTIAPLPGLGAVDLCRELRRRGRTPLLVVSVTNDADWVHALEAGADDHLSAPCDGLILEARLRALLRRADGRLAPRRVTRIGDVTITRRGHGVSVEPTLALNSTQIRLLQRLTDHPGTVVSLDVLHNACGTDLTPAQVAAELNDLRRQLGESSAEPDALQEVTGAGWRLLPPPPP